MKIGIISDVHGNYPALKAVISELKAHHVKRIFCAGDIVGYYPYVNEVIEELQKQKIKCVLGNHDFSLLSGLPVRESYSGNLTVNFARKKITAKNLRFLASLKAYESIRLNGSEILMMHGGLDNLLNQRIHFEEDLTLPSGKKTLFGGHTHVPSVFRRGAVLYVNPGSSGQPRDFDIRASACVMDLSSGECKFLRVLYDIDAVYSKMRELGFDPRIAWSLYTGDWVGSAQLSPVGEVKLSASMSDDFELRRFEYCLSMRRKSSGFLYHYVVKDGAPCIFSAVGYFKRKADAERWSSADTNIKLKRNVAAFFRKLDSPLIEDPAIFDEAEKLRGSF